MGKPETTKPIAFRLGHAQERRLREIAAAAGCTPGEYARELVLQKLDEQDNLTKQAHRLERQLLQLQSDFALAAEAILTVFAAKKDLTPEQVKRWVDEKLRHLPH